jgi:hypothetical protein
MAPVECVHESDVLMMVTTGRWPDRAPAELREHAASCEVCRDLAVIAVAIEADAAAGPTPSIPSAGTVWWRAQLRARQEAARVVVRPITAAQALSLAALFGLAGAVFGATASWFQGAVRWFGGALGTVRNSIRLPELPTLPQDVSGIWIGYWVVLGVVVFSVIVAAGLMRWAMKED